MEVLEELVAGKYRKCMYGVKIDRKGKTYKAFCKRMKKTKGFGDTYRAFCALGNALLGPEHNEDIIRVYFPLLCEDLVIGGPKPFGGGGGGRIKYVFSHGGLTEMFGEYDEEKDENVDYIGRPVRIVIVKRLGRQWELIVAKWLCCVETILAHTDGVIVLHDQDDKAVMGEKRNRSKRRKEGKTNAPRLYEDNQKFRDAFHMVWADLDTQMSDLFFISVEALLDIPIEMERRRSVREKKQRNVQNRMRYQRTGVPPPRLFREKDPALSYARNKGQEMVSWDIKKEGAKAFLVCSFETLYVLRFFPYASPRLFNDNFVANGRDFRGLWMKSGHGCLNEVMFKNRETKPFVDMEYEWPGNEHLFDAESVTRITCSTIDMMITALSMLPGFQDEKLAKTDFIVLDSSRVKKISKHIIYDGPKVFRGMSDVLLFSKVMKYRTGMGVLLGQPEVMNTMIRAKVTSSKNGNAPSVMDLAEACVIDGVAHTSVIDWAVYSTNQKSLRMAYCCKFGKPDIQLLPDFSSGHFRSIEAIQSKYEGFVDLLDLSPEEKEQKLVFFASALQFVPEQLAASSVTISESQVQTLLSACENQLKKQRANGGEYNIACAASFSIAEPSRKRPKADQAGEYAQKRPRPNGMQQKSIQDKHIRRIVVEWIEQHIKEWKTENVRRGRIKMVSQYGLRAGKRWFHSLCVYPYKATFCPIKHRINKEGGKHSKPGKPGIVFLKEGNGKYFFVCQSPPCKTHKKTVFDKHNNNLFVDGRIDINKLIA